MNTGKKIRKIRLDKGFSQENMADMLRISTTTYGDIERNKSRVSKIRLDKIVEVIGVSTEDIEALGDSVSNFFDQCNSPQVNAGSKNSNSQNNNYKRNIISTL